jgi:ribosome-associated heat shock protein Hsp15
VTALAGPSDPPSTLPTARLDVWLDVACLFKTRSAAQSACRGGKVEVNGQTAKPHKLLHVGDEIRITRGGSRRQVVAVLTLAEKHLAKADARKLYEDRTPPPTPEELEARAFERAYPRPRNAPNRRDQRALRQFKRQTG